MIGTTQNSHGAYMIHDENTAHLNTVRDHIGPMRKQNMKKIMGHICSTNMDEKTKYEKNHGSYMFHKYGHCEVHIVH